MKIAYAARHGVGGNEDERHIAEALRDLGHEVTLIAQTGSPAGVCGHDLLLGHHWYNVNLSWFRSLDMPKAIWFFDKIAWADRERWVREIAPLCTRFFLSDATWARTAGISTLRILRQGIGGRNEPLGAPKQGRWGATVAHVGGVYGERAMWAKSLEARYKGRFQAIQGVHGRDLYDLCATVPVIVAPEYPSDDGYWSNRIYLILGSGGFLLHPRCTGVEEEYRDGEHLVLYRNEVEMHDQIEYYLRHEKERRRIQQAGFKRTWERYTYRHRVQELLCQLGYTSTKNHPPKRV